MCIVLITGVQTINIYSKAFPCLLAATPATHPALDLDKNKGKEERGQKPLHWVVTEQVIKQNKALHISACGNMGLLPSLAQAVCGRWAGPPGTSSGKRSAKQKAFQDSK